MAERDLEKENERLRNEAAARRIENKRYKQAFEGFSDAQVDYFLGIFEQLGDNNARAEGVQRLYDFAKEAVDAYNPGSESPPPEEELMPEETTPNPSVAEDLEKQIADRVEAQLKLERKKLDEELTAAQQRIEIEATARALGYEPNTSGYLMLMHHAAQIPGAEEMPISDVLPKAHEKVREELLDVYTQMAAASPPTEEEPPTIEPTLQESEELAEKMFAPTAQAGGAAPVDHPESKKSTDWAEARSGADAWLAEALKE